MSVYMALYRLRALSRLPSVRSYVSTLQFSRRTLWLSDCHTLHSTKAISVLCTKRQSWISSILHSDASWQKITWQCGFHTTPHRNIPPVLWLVIKPLARVAAMLSGRWMHVYTVYYMTLMLHSHYERDFTIHKCQLWKHYCFYQGYKLLPSYIVMILYSLNCFVHSCTAVHRHADMHSCSCPHSCWLCLSSLLWT